MDTPDTYTELAVAYLAIWFCLVGFVVKLMMDQRKTNIELEKLQNELNISE